MPETARVGIFFIVALALLAALVLRIEEWNPFGPEGQRVEARFATVAGLDDRSAVRVAGVRVGRVDGVRLAPDGRGATVTLLLEAEVPLTEGASARIANQGLLGDKFVELDPGPAHAPPRAPGAPIAGTSPPGFDQAMAKLEQVGDALTRALGGVADGGGLGDLVASLRATADELRAVVAENRASLGGTVRNFERVSAALAADLPRVTARLESVLARIDAVVAENRGSLRDGLAGVKELSSSVQRSVDNLNAITDKIASGEGTLGKLVHSDQAHDQLLGALRSVEQGVTALGDTLGRAERLRLDVGLESAYLADAEDARGAVRVDVLPRGAESPRIFRFELVADPYGRVSEKQETTIVTRPDGGTETVTTTRLFRDLRRNEYSALVGFPLAERRARVWAGLIENTGGVALDAWVVPERLSLALEAYDFGRELDLDPHLRLSAHWFPWRNLFLSAGWDDPLVGEFATPFVGLGVRWSDDDLKYLLGSVPDLR
jgi:phospholipid/cholesterol/gamma-HCH transport system substrate-binding protein